MSFANAGFGHEAGPPNLVFIMADDLGYGDLGCYGQARIKTPHIDRLAAEGMKFTQFYAGSTVCAPSRCVLMTGYHTGHCFIRGNGKDNLRPDDITVAEVLRPAGYKSGLIGKWGLGHEGSLGVPTKQGFDFFFGYLDQHHAHNYYPAFLLRNETRVPLRNVVPGDGKWGRGVASKKVDYSQDLIADETDSFVRAHADEPFFLYLALTLPHANNQARQEGMEIPSYGEYEKTDWPEPQKGHAAMITRMDSDVGKLVALLEELGIGDNTLVIFTSDNGPHREGGNDPDFQDSNGPLKGIKRSLHEGGIRVPLIARCPNLIEPGTVSDHVGYFCDIMPTFAELAGSSAQCLDNIDGLSFAPTLTGNHAKQKKHDFLYWAFYERGGARAVRFDDWKAIQQPIHTPVRLYNLAKDLGEETDVAAEHVDIVEAASQLIDAQYTPSDRWQFPNKKKKK